MHLWIANLITASNDCQGSKINNFAPDENVNEPKLVCDVHVALGKRARKYGGVHVLGCHSNHQNNFLTVLIHLFIKKETFDTIGN